MSSIPSQEVSHRLNLSESTEQESFGREGAKSHWEHQDSNLCKFTIKYFASLSKLITERNLYCCAIIFNLLLFQVKGPNSSQLVQDCMKDLYIMKVFFRPSPARGPTLIFQKPNSIAYNQKNDIRPFEDATKLEFFAKKNDSSLFVFGSHNKKRPHNMIIGRMYDYHIFVIVIDLLSAQVRL